jgi:hypothetical protein
MMYLNRYTDLDLGCHALGRQGLKMGLAVRHEHRRKGHGHRHSRLCNARGSIGHAHCYSMGYKQGSAPRLGL